MCGICGYFLYDNKTNGVGLASDNHISHSLGRNVLQKMNDKIKRRGPDAEGYYLSPDNNLGFAHRRLAIQDLSEHGVQPMISDDGRYILIYNGELYNTEDLINRFRIKTKGHSDTEVLLKAIAAYSLEEVLLLLNGIFAFALYDNEQKRLSLVRDHFGIKPLYYHHNPETNLVIFGSELKAMRANPLMTNKISPNAAAQYFKFGYVPDPLAIYENTFKVPQGAVVHIHESNIHDNKSVEKCVEAPKYYHPIGAVLPYSINDRAISYDEKLQNLHDQLKLTVKRQMISDVPLGAFLSGGIDSSLVVALMQEVNHSKVKTFSIGFDEAAYNEAPFAKKIAEHLNTDHQEVILTAQDAQNQIPLLPLIYDEPFADSSQIPTLLVSEIAKKSVTVALSGDGGDEGFGGYVRYQALSALSRNILSKPKALRSFAKTIGKSFSPSFYDLIYAAFKPFLPQKYQFTHFGDKVHKALDLFGVDNALALYERLVTLWVEPPIAADNLAKISQSDLNSQASEPLPKQPLPQQLLPMGIDGRSLTLLHQLMLMDFQGYLVGDILTKVDRASMHHSLEVRVPLLDSEVVKHGFLFTPQELIVDGKGKKPLRDILSQYVPTELFERPKQGFGIPLDSWLRNELKNWADELLSFDNCQRLGLDGNAIAKKWQQHLKGGHNHAHMLWCVISFITWIEENDATF